MRRRIEVTSFDGVIHTDAEEPSVEISGNNSDICAISLYPTFSHKVKFQELARLSSPSRSRTKRKKRNLPGLVINAGMDKHQPALLQFLNVRWAFDNPYRNSL